MEDEPADVDTGRESADVELHELDDISIEDIARLLRRDNREARDTVVAVGRAYR